MKSAVLFLAFACGTAVSAQTLHVYGPGGPIAPLRECAARFTARTHIPVIATAGPEKQWFAAAQTNADLIYGGAEYMLTQFSLDHPGFLLAGSRTELYSRSVGILVRTGNPKRIHSLADLARPGIHLLDVNGAGQLGLWEDLAGGFGLIEGLQRNIALSVDSSAKAMKQWSARPDLDAWITYESWHNRLPGTTTLVRLPPGQRLYRGTPIAIAQRSQYKARDAALLDELRSQACHEIFIQQGWR